jgi:hypothetical protein
MDALIGKIGGHTKKPRRGCCRPEHDPRRIPLSSNSLARSGREANDDLDTHWSCLERFPDPPSVTTLENLPFHIESLRRSFPERFWSHVDVRGPDECWPWLLNKTRTSYGLLSAGGRVGRKRSFSAHRAAYMLAHGGVPDELNVCHSCDNPPCCNPAHLWLGTHEQNMADSRVKGRMAATRARGEANGFSKLTAEKVREMRRRYAEGSVTQAQLARDYGISPANVSLVVNRLRWKEVA